MKKLLAVLSVITILFTLFPSMKASASVQAPDKPIEVDCPPSYVGQTKCFYVTNPTIKDSAKTVQPEVKLPEEKTVRTTSTGKPITNHPFLWALSTATGFAASQSETVQSAVETYWQTVDQYDKDAGIIANAVTEETAEALQYAFESAKMGATGFIDLTEDVWNDLFDNTSKTLSNNEDVNFKTFFENKFADTYSHNDVQEVLSRFKNAYPNVTILHIYIENYESLTPSNKTVHIFYLWFTSFSEWSISRIGYSIGGSVKGTSNNLGVDKDLTEALAEFQTWFSGRNYGKKILPDQKKYHEIGTPTGLGIVAPLPISNNTIPKRINIGDKPYREVENPISPAHPELEPMPQIQEDGTIKKTGSKIGGHTLIDEEGYPIDFTTGERTSTTPITTAVTNPLTPNDPQYKTPTQTPTTPTAPPTTTPTSKCNQCLPDLIPNFFGLFLVFFTFLAACLAYLFKLVVFILKIPTIPERQFTGTVGDAVEYFKTFSIGNLEVYSTLLSLVALLLSFAIYKVIRRMY